MAHVLLIEDDPAIRSLLIRALTERGHAVHAVPTAIAGLHQTVESSPELIVLDLGLPDLDGARLLPMLRGVTSVPVIVATAQDDEQTIVQVLDAGADDYVVKPFTAEQLDARIRAVLRRAQGQELDDPIVVGELVVDGRTREASLRGTPLELTRKEFDLLAYLAAHAGEVVTKRVLLAEVWRQPYGGADKTVDVHLSWLRRKLGETAADPQYLHSVRGVGVKLVEPGS